MKIGDKILITYSNDEAVYLFTGKIGVVTSILDAIFYANFERYSLRFNNNNNKNYYYKYVKYYREINLKFLLNNLC